MAQKSVTLKTLKTPGIKTQQVSAASIPVIPAAAPAGKTCGCANGGTCVGCDGRCTCKTWGGCHFLGTLKQKKAIAGIVASFFILWATQIVMHGNLLMPAYAQTPQLWRNTADMSLPGILGGNLLLSVVTVILFYQAQKFHTHWEGIRLGKLIFMPLIVAALYQWATTPLPGSIAVTWAIGYCVQGMVIGFVLTRFGKCGCLSGKWFGGCGKDKAKVHQHGAGCC